MTVKERRKAMRKRSFPIAPQRVKDDVVGLVGMILSCLAFTPAIRPTNTLAVWLDAYATAVNRLPSGCIQCKPERINRLVRL